MPDLFADSFALVALLEGNDRYVRIFRRKSLVTTALNIVEVYATLIRRLGHEEAHTIARSFLSIVAEVPPEVALAAGEFRNSMRVQGRDCSYIDAWGYAAARHLGIPFLTGDPSFRHVEGVEFVR